MDWLTTEENVVTLWREGRYPDAIQVLDRFLSARPAEDEISLALAYRGESHDRLGQLESARADLMRAKSLTSFGTYSSYALSLKLGGLCEAMEALADARQHYVEALQVILSALDLSGGTALACLLRLSGSRPLSDQETQLVEAVVRKSWAVLAIPGEPEVTDLVKAAAILQEHQGHRVGNAQ